MSDLLEDTSTDTTTADTSADTSTDTSSSADLTSVDLSTVDNATLFSAMRDRLPDEYKSHQEFQNHKDFEGFSKTFMNQLKMIGQKPEVPKAPESPDGYIIPEGFDIAASKISQEEVDSYRQYLLQEKVPSDVGNKVLAKWLGDEAAIQQELANQQVKQLEDAKAYLETTFGEELNEAKTEAANFFNNKVPEDLQNLAKQSGLLGNPYFIHILAEVAKDYRDDKSIMAFKSGTTENAREEFDKLKSDPEFMAQLYSNDKSVSIPARKKYEEMILKANQVKVK